MNRQQKIERLRNDLRDEQYRHQCTQKQLNEKIMERLQEPDPAPKLFDYTVHYENDDRVITYRADRLDGFSTPLATFVRDGVCIGMSTRFLYIDSVPVEEVDNK